MAPYLLNVELVESLQRAIQRGRSVDVLGNVGSATLAGMLEYGCLRHEYPDRLPAAPGGINATELGRALAEIVSPLGVREQGPPKPSVKHINAQSVEFQLLPSLSSQDQDIESQSFLARFERSAQQVGFSNGTAAKLQSAFAEMCENAVLHSQSTLTPVAGYAVMEGTAQFSVIDVGIGVKATRAVWKDGFTLYGQKLDSLLSENIAAYSSWVEERVAAARQAAPTN